MAVTYRDEHRKHCILEPCQTYIIHKYKILVSLNDSAYFEIIVLPWFDNSYTKTVVV